MSRQTENSFTPSRIQMTLVNICQYSDTKKNPEVMITVKTALHSIWDHLRLPLQASRFHLNRIG
ncbi:hypothetical protein GE061_012583, partial [Apolygus lucorum]